MKKILIGVGVLVVLLIAGALIAPNFIDWNAQKGRIAAQVRRPTPRKTAAAPKAKAPAKDKPAPSA